MAAIPEAETKVRGADPTRPCKLLDGGTNALCPATRFPLESCRDDSTGVPGSFVMRTSADPDFSPASRTKPRSLGSGLIVHGLAWALFLGLLAFLVPKFEVIFKDFGVDLPSLTKIAIKASHFLIYYPIVAVPPVLLVLVLDGWLRSKFSKRQQDGKSRGWSMVMLAIPLLLIALLPRWHHHSHDSPGIEALRVRPGARPSSPRTDRGWPRILRTASIGRDRPDSGPARRSLGPWEFWPRWRSS